MRGNTRRATPASRLFVVLAATAVALAGLGSAAGAGVHAKKPPSVPGFDGKTIKLGVITPLSGIASIVGKPLTNGNKVYWDSKNAQGGVGGKYKVDLQQEDSKYQVDTALQSYDKLKGNVVAFNQVLGTQIVKSVLTQLRSDQLTGQPATLDSLWVKQPYLVPIGAPYQVEAANGLDYYLKNGGKGKKICAIAQDDEYGGSGLEGLTFASKQLKFKVDKTVRFATGADVSAQVGELAEAKCDGVFVASLPNDTNSIVNKMIGRNYSPQIIALAPSWLSGFENNPNYQDFLTKHYLLITEGPAWGDTSVAGMKKMIEDQQKYAADQKPDQYFAFGYAESWAMDQVLEKAVKNGDLSKAGIQKALAQVGTLKFGGLLGDYKYGKSAKDRDPGRASTIDKIAPGKPIGLEIVQPMTASATAKKLKFEG
jgi:ABC-type branched-subunit amino acid transport system substrate-binding protein